LKKETIRGLKNGFKLAKSLARRSSRSARKQNPARNRRPDEAKAKELFDALRQRIEEITVDSEMPSDRYVGIINGQLGSLEELRNSFDADINALRSSDQDDGWTWQMKYEAADLVRAKLAELMVIHNEQFWKDVKFETARRKDQRQEKRIRDQVARAENETRRAAQEEERGPRAGAPPLSPGITPLTPAREATRGKRRPLAESDKSPYPELDHAAMA